MIEYIKTRINKVKKELDKRNKEHSKEAIKLHLAPMRNNGWIDTLKLEGELKVLKNLYSFTANQVK